MATRLTLFLLILFAATSAHAALPYTTRTHGYSGWSTATRGDIRTVGMGGATAGLADTFLATLDNPAGLAMTMGTGDLNITSNNIKDGYVQDERTELSLGSYGVALNGYPWGFSLGYRSSYREGDTEANIQVREWQANTAHLFDNNKLSIGAGLIFGVSDHTIGVDTKHTPALGVQMGFMYQLPRRWLIGGSYRPAMRYADITPVPNEPPALPGFFAPLDIPSKFELGFGWIPNRFATIDFGFALVGSSENTALLRDDTIRTGTSVTLQPKVGASYVWAEFDHVKGSVFAGSYFESTRIEGAYNRLHITGGIEIKAWFVGAGYGIDKSAHYTNQLVSLGIDPFTILELIDIIPKAWRPPRAGLFPDPTHLSDSGLPRPLVRDWRPRGPNMDPIKVGLDIPNKIEKKFENLIRKSP